MSQAVASGRRRAAAGRAGTGSESATVDTVGTWQSPGSVCQYNAGAPGAVGSPARTSGQSWHLLGTGKVRETRRRQTLP
jgi:hypothetical protein